MADVESIWTSRQMNPEESLFSPGMSLPQQCEQGDSAAEQTSALLVRPESALSF